MNINSQYKVIMALNTKVIRVKSISFDQANKLKALGYTIIFK